jgi:hypothetical protein
MIATTRLLDYPLLAISPTMQIKLSTALMSMPTKHNVITYINSYFHVTGIYLDEKAITSLQDIDDTLFGLEGYLLSNTNFTPIYIAQSNTKARQLLAASIGITIKGTNNVKNTQTERQERSVKFYNFITKCASTLQYYGGWWVSARSGKPLFIDLVQPWNSYGHEIASYIRDLISEDFKRYARASCSGRTTHLKRALSLMCRLYPTTEELSALQSGRNVNEFVELLFADSKAETITNGHSVKAFYRGWTSTIAIFTDILTNTAIMAAPEWPLLCPTYKSANRSDEDDSVFDKAIMDIPLVFSDEKAFKIFEATVNDELNFIEERCIIACQKEMDDYHSVIEKAKYGKVIADFRGMKFGIDFNENDLCQTWQAFGYRIIETGVFNVVPSMKFIGIVKPIRAHTLFPFMHLLVQHHPFITPPWLTEFELFDETGQQVNFTQSGDEWIATGFKPRAAGHEQQSVVLTETTKKIFDEIIALTSTARDYLRSIGDDGYRRLLLSGARGLGKPIPIDLVTSISNENCHIPLRAVLREGTSETFPIDRIERIISKLSLRSLRNTIAIQIYLQTLSMQAVALALRHAPGSEKTSNGYIAGILRAFAMERWVRLFQNAIIYEAMKESPYLLEAVDFSTIEELNEFLLTHKEHYKIQPEEELKIHQSVADLSNDEYDRMYIELNLEKLEILLCIYEIVHAALRTGTEVVAAAMKWYSIARVIYQAVHLHKEGTLSGYCSRSVLSLFSKANPSKQLFLKIKEVIHV